MASIRKKATSPFWFACFYREDGTRTQRSTRTTDRKEALRIALELEQAHGKKMTEAQVRRVLSDLTERLTGAPLASSTLADYARGWLDRKEREIEGVSFLAYKTAINDFVASVPNKAALGIQYVVPADIAQFRDRACARASAKTANNKLKVVRTMFQTAWRDGFVTENPAAKVTTLKTADSIRRPFTFAEVKRVHAVADNEWRGMLLAGLYTGQRLKDIATLRWSNVDLAAGEISLRTSKTGRSQEIPIAPTLRAHLLAVPAADDPRSPIFPRANTLVENDGDVGRLSQQFHEILVAAGLAKERTTAEKANGKGIGRNSKRERNELSFHRLRHTATSLLKNSGVSEIVARDLIGHDSEAVSRNYSHVDRDKKREAISMLPDVLA